MTDFLNTHLILSSHCIPSFRSGQYFDIFSDVVRTKRTIVIDTRFRYIHTNVYMCIYVYTIYMCIYNNLFTFSICIWSILIKCSVRKYVECFYYLSSLLGAIRYLKYITAYTFQTKTNKINKINFQVFQ